MTTTSNAATSCFAIIEVCVLIIEQFPFADIISMSHLVYGTREAAKLVMRGRLLREMSFWFPDTDHHILYDLIESSRAAISGYLPLRLMDLSINRPTLIYKEPLSIISPQDQHARWISLFNSCGYILQNDKYLKHNGYHGSIVTLPYKTSQVFDDRY